MPFVVRVRLGPFWNHDNGQAVTYPTAHAGLEED